MKTLPDPVEAPENDIVVWDGKCNFCRSQVSRLRAWDGGKLTYISLHDPRIKELCPNLSESDLMKQMWVLTSDGKQFGGADAIRYLSTRLWRLYWAAPLLHIPFSIGLWRFLYRQVANRRYKIAGENCDPDGTCHLHR